VERSSNPKVSRNMKPVATLEARQRRKVPKRGVVSGKRSKVSIFGSSKLHRILKLCRCSAQLKIMQLKRDAPPTDPGPSVLSLLFVPVGGTQIEPNEMDLREDEGEGESRVIPNTPTFTNYDST
jgi:hypothetical protein